MATSRSEQRKIFVERLNEACDQAPKLIPEHGQGRQRIIADRMEVSQETVSKWFKGIAMPDQDTIERLADMLQVDYSWLALGVEPASYISPDKRRMEARWSNGAVHLTWGMFELHDAKCALPAENDNRAKYTDFYVTIHGTMTPVNVSYGKKVSHGRFDLILPREYTDVRCIGVINTGVGTGASKFHFVDLVDKFITEHKQMKKGLPSVQLNYVDKGVYKTGASKWPIIKFGDG